MADKVIFETESYILSLDIDEDTKKDILETFRKYSNIFKSFYDRTYSKNAIVANDYLYYQISLFRQKLDYFLNSKNNPLEYIDYILDNRDLFDASLLSDLSREKKERLIEIYQKIISGTYMRSFYEEILTHSSKNFDMVYIELYELAKYMGYDDEIAEESIYDYSKKKIPPKLRAMINAVE